MSNLINVRNPITTNPTANEEWANNPSKASPGKFVFFWSLIKIKATADEVRKTENAILISIVTANVTPRRAEWAKVSPKKDNLLHTIKQPNEPVTIAIPVSYTHLTLPTSDLV